MVELHSGEARMTWILAAEVDDGFCEFPHQSFKLDLNVKSYNSEAFLILWYTDILC